jgi:hypothetical protein
MTTLRGFTATKMDRLVVSTMPIAGRFLPPARRSPGKIPEWVRKRLARFHIPAEREPG